MQCMAYLMFFLAVATTEACPNYRYAEEFDIGECSWEHVEAYFMAWDEVYENVPDMVDDLWLRRYGIRYPDWRDDVREYYGLY